jgi:RNA recognition motif-containing protein
MSKKLYVGNLSFETTSDDLRRAFSEHGAVLSAEVISDRETGRSRGFGFVEMSDGAAQAIKSLDLTELQGRKITVNEARPREDRGHRGRSSGRRSY